MLENLLGGAPAAPGSGTLRAAGATGRLALHAAVGAGRGLLRQAFPGSALARMAGPARTSETRHMLGGEEAHASTAHMLADIRESTQRIATNTQISAGLLTNSLHEQQQANKIAKHSSATTGSTLSWLLTGAGTVWFASRLLPFLLKGGLYVAIGTIVGKLVYDYFAGPAGAKEAPPPPPETPPSEAPPSPYETEIPMPEQPTATPPEAPEPERPPVVTPPPEPPRPPPETKPRSEAPRPEYKQLAGPSLREAPRTAPGVTPAAMTESPFQGLRIKAEKITFRADEITFDSQGRSLSSAAGGVTPASFTPPGAPPPLVPGGAPGGLPAAPPIDLPGYAPSVRGAIPSPMGSASRMGLPGPGPSAPMATAPIMPGPSAIPMIPGGSAAAPPGGYLGGETSAVPSARPGVTRDRGAPHEAPEPQPGKTAATPGTSMLTGQPLSGFVPQDTAVSQGPVDRSQFNEELKNPALVQRLASMVKGEVGLGRHARYLDRQKIELEAHFNRAAARQQSLWKDLYHGRGGYYASSTFRRLGKGDLDYFKKNVLEPVVRGSNRGQERLGFMPTGNASGKFAQRRAAAGVYARYGWLSGRSGVGEMFAQERYDAPRMGNIKMMPEGKRVQTETVRDTRGDFTMGSEPPMTLMQAPSQEVSATEGGMYDAPPPPTLMSVEPEAPSLTPPVERSAPDTAPAPTKEAAAVEEPQKTETPDMPSPDPPAAAPDLNEDTYRI